MQVITDAPTLLRALGSYAFNPSIDEELADKLQSMPSNDVDRIFIAIELLHAFRDRVGPAGLELLGQLTAFADLQKWTVPGKPERIKQLLESAKRDLGDTSVALLVEDDPEPITTYRQDGKDYREEADPDAPARKAPVPKEVSPRQFRLALIQSELDDEVEAIIASQDKAARVSWEFATVISRNDPLIVGSGEAMGKTDEEIDDIFRLAATL